MVYDVLIIGGGPAGYLAAERAGHAGLSVLLIEKRSLGGVCLNEGCIPSKTFLNSAKIYEHALHGDVYGVTTKEANIDHAKVVARKNKVVKALVAGVGAQMRANKVTVVEDTAFIEGRDAEGFSVKTSKETYKALRLIICSGSSPVVPPIPGVKEGLEKGFVLTNREILDLTEAPKELVIVGGGVIGLEMASYFSTIGTKVTVVEMLDKIAGPTDREISSILMKNYEKQGVAFCLSAKVVKVTDDSVVYEKDGKTCEVKADKVLLSIGRRANTKDLGLENIGVMLERGAIVTDRFMKTNVVNVYAAGDVNGKSMLAHTAYREAEVAVNTLLQKKDIMRYHAISSVIYTHPEVASVGETEDTAKQKGLDVIVGKVSMNFSGRYMAENEGGDGICKVIVDRKSQALIGCQLIGSYASEIIVAAATMIENEMRVCDIKEIVFPHPTVSEVIREAIFSL